MTSTCPLGSTAFAQRCSILPRARTARGSSGGRHGPIERDAMLSPTEPAEGQVGWVLRSAEAAPRSAAARKAAESGDIHTGMVSMLEKRHPSDVRTTSKW
jgi:hypothetical protein